MKEANQAVEQVRSYSNKGIPYASEAVSWDTALVVSVTDASFANEAVITSNGNELPHRTQKAFMILLVDPDITKKDTAATEADLVCVKQTGPPVTPPVSILQMKPPQWSTDMDDVIRYHANQPVQLLQSSEILSKIKDFEDDDLTFHVYVTASKHYSISV